MPLPGDVAVLRRRWGAWRVRLDPRAAAMAILIVGLAVFLGMHSIAIATPRLRARAVASLGANGWRGVYSLVSAAGFVLILYGFHKARLSPVVLYVPPAWMRDVTFLL